jgi:hypothetical protein
MLRGTEVALDKIGSGTYGSVYKYGQQSSAHLLAVKIYKSVTFDVGIEWDALREIVLLKALHHKNVIGFSQALFDPSGAPWCVLEYATGGTLAGLLSNENLIWYSEMFTRYTKDLFSGLAYLHSLGVVHRDIKPENLLLCGPTNTLKIADFGCAHLGTGSLPSYDNPDELRTDPVTSLWYRAPEVVFGTRVHGPALDIWSAGLVVVEMIVCSGPVFNGVKTNDEMVAELCAALGTPTEDNDLMPCLDTMPAGPRHTVRTAEEAFLPDWLNVPQWCRDVAIECVRMEPTRRPTARWVLQCIAAPKNHFVPMEVRVPDLQVLRAVTLRGEFRPACPTDLTERRGTLATWLFAACVSIKSDTSRRVYHHSIYMLDKLVGVPAFWSKLAGDDLGMAAACVAIACLASKLCQTAHLTLDAMCSKCMLQNTQYSGLAPTFLSHGLTQQQVDFAEREIVTLLDWGLWGVVAYDVEKATQLCGDEETRQMRYTVQYAIDTLLCAGGGCGHSQHEVVSAGFWATSEAIHKNGILEPTSPCNIPDLVRLCVNSMRKARGGPLYTYYSALKRGAVSIVCSEMENN